MSVKYEKIMELQNKLCTNKNTRTYTEEDIQYLITPMGSAAFLKELEDDKPKSDIIITKQKDRYIGLIEEDIVFLKPNKPILNIFDDDMLEEIIIKPVPKPKPKKRLRKYDRVKCEICNKIYVRSNKVQHCQSNFHNYAKVNRKLLYFLSKK